MVDEADLLGRLAVELERIDVSPTHAVVELEVEGHVVE